MSIRSVYLVNAGNDHRLSIPHDGSYPALGVLSLGTMLKTYHPDVEVKVYDGQIVPQELIRTEIIAGKPDVVGVSVLGASYQNALDIARAAKTAHATTLFGNDQTAVLGKNMLNLREEIDYICTADVGEYALLSFIDFLDGKRSVKEVPKLLYRTSQGLAFNNLPEVPGNPSRATTYFDGIPIPDRTFFSPASWNLYLKNYLSRYASEHHGEVKGVATINRARGCGRVKEPCGFCGIQDLSLRFSSPDIFWADVRKGKEQTGANFYYEAFDSLSSAPGWVQKLVDAKPCDMEDVRFFVYTQTKETTPKLIDLYRKMGVYRVNIGYESGDDMMLRRMKGPMDSVEQHKKASLLLRDAGIRVYGGLVPGAPGETQESLENTISFGEWLVDEHIVAGIDTQPVWPEFNAEFGKWMMHPDYARAAAQRMGFTIRNQRLLDSLPAKYQYSDAPDIEELSRDFASIFCNVAYEDLVRTSEKIKHYAKDHGIAEGSALFPSLSD